MSANQNQGKDSVGGNAHAVLGASSCERWWNCPGSVQISRGHRNATSVYAAEGTAAHTLGEHCLRNRSLGLMPIDLLGKIIDAEKHLFRDGVEADGVTLFEVDEDMCTAVQLYLDTVNTVVSSEPDAVLLIEQRFTLASLDPPDDMFGTSDAVIYLPSRRRLIPIDYKHGAGIAVDAVGNKQLRYYALGAALANSQFVFDDVEIIIVQPRAWHIDGGVRREVIPFMELFDWTGDLLAAARRTQGPGAELNAGDWCKFCPASAVCPALRERAMKSAMAEFGADGAITVPSAPADLSGSQLASILDAADIITEWLNAVRAFAHARAESGTLVPGYKLAAKRATRKWIDEVATAAALAALGLPREDVYVEKLKSPAQVEKLIGGKRKGLITALYEAKSSGTNLVREETSRPAVAPSAMREFSAVPAEPAALPPPVDMTTVPNLDQFA